MVFRNRLLAVVAGVVLLASPQFGFAETTTIEVPQGSGVFPTIGQVNCLEELGSGRFCAATYECSDDSGELWGDLANHNGRRAIGATSPVANQRDCVITVDGRAAVRWLTGYRPVGREGELVGLTTSAGALPPVVRTMGTDDGGRGLLFYILERYDTTLEEFVGHTIDNRGYCDQVPYTDHAACVEGAEHGLLSLFIGPGGHTADIALTPDNAATRCLVSAWEGYCDWAWEERNSDEDEVTPNVHRCPTPMDKADFLIFGSQPMEGESVSYALHMAFESHVTDELYYGRAPIQFGNYNEEAGFPCRELAKDELSKMGIGVRYCGDECPDQTDPDEHYYTFID